MGDVAAIAHQLAHSRQATRIHKLLVYLCRNVWLSSAEQLQAASIPTLLPELPTRYPQFEDLRSRLGKVVQTLSKPVEYTEVAELLLLTVAPLYSSGAGDSDDEATVLDIRGEMPASLNSPISLFRDQAQVAQLLAEHPQKLRIKKLMWCVVRQTWESDLEKLERLDLVRLVDDLWRLYATYPQLQEAFQQTVQNLSKPEEYGQLAQRILQAMASLYGDMLTPEALQQGESLATIEPILPPKQPPSLPSPIEPILFDIRQEVMKYVPPLRAKILLSALLNPPFEGSTETWSTLRQQSLMHLLEAVINIYRQPDMLAMKLRLVAQTLPESEEYEAVIDVIVKQVRAHRSDTTATKQPLPDPAASSAPITQIEVDEDDASGSLDWATLMKTSVETGVLGMNPGVLGRGNL